MNHIQFWVFVQIKSIAFEVCLLCIVRIKQNDGRLGLHFLDVRLKVFAKQLRAPPQAVYLEVKVIFWCTYPMVHFANAVTGASKTFSKTAANLQDRCSRRLAPLRVNHIRTYACQHKCRPSEQKFRSPAIDCAGQKLISAEFLEPQTGVPGSLRIDDSVLLPNI